MMRKRRPEKIMAVVLNGLKSLYREQRQERSIILLPTLQITEAKEADALFFSFPLLYNLRHSNPMQQLSCDESPRRRHREESDFWSNKLAFNPHFLHYLDAREFCDCSDHWPRTAAADERAGGAAAKTPINLRLPNLHL